MSRFKKLKELKEKRGVIQEFKEFAIKGNMVDLAVGLVIGAAFNSVIQSLVGGIIMPLAGLVTLGEDFTGFKYQISPDQALEYGTFIQNLINFFVIALAVFIVVKIINKIRSPKQDEPAAPTETELLTEIRDLMKGRSGE